MNFEESADLWRQIRVSSLIELRQDVVELAVRYARIRVDYQLASPESQGELEGARTACHNALISACDILARNMAQHGEDATWRERLGDDRKRIGDFACYLHALLGIAAR